MAVIHHGFFLAFHYHFLAVAVVAVAVARLIPPSGDDATDSISNQHPSAIQKQSKEPKEEEMDARCLGFGSTRAMDRHPLALSGAAAAAAAAVAVVAVVAVVVVVGFRGG